MDLQEIAKDLMRNHLFSNTRKSYSCGMNKFRIFCQQQNIRKLDRNAVLLFIASLHATKIAPSSAKVYLAAVRNELRERGLPDFTADDFIPLAIKGMERLDQRPSEARLPITMALMRLIKTRLRLSQLDSFVQHLYWAACCFAFFGLLRASEYTTHFVSSFLLSEHTIRFSDISVLSASSLKLHLRHTKTGTHQEVSLLATGHSVCPVRAFHHFRLQREKISRPDFPLFTFKDGTFLTQQNFNHAIKSLLKHVPDCSHYSSHSFRIGNATQAAASHTQEAYIQKAGRWKSSAYKGYIRPSSPSRHLQFF